MSEMKFPVGIQSFEDLRNKGFVYIDKTAFVYQLVDTGKYYFLSRPRRFGKSLLMSTIEAYLSGRKDLFEGLALEKLETEWTQYPILHLDLNSQKYDTPEALTEVLDETLTKWETIYGSNDAEIGLGRRFGGVMQRAYEKTGRQVVVLIDEYDKPLLQAYGNDDLLNDYRGTLKAFYGNLKSCDKYIKFALLTGVTKFGKVSVFSDLNNLMDISMDLRYAPICGITEGELHDYFDNEIQLLAEAQKMTVEETYAKLKEDFDGYHFHEDAEGMYNPFSILNTLAKRQFRDYWFETGTPTLLVDMLRNCDYDLAALTSEEVTTDVLDCIFDNDNPLPVIFQSGYLTIKSYDKEFNTYTLCYPNREVKEGFIRFLLPYYTQNKRHNTFDLRRFVQDLRSGRVEEFMTRLQSLFADTPYLLVHGGDRERHYHNVIYLLTRLMGFYVKAEYQTAAGRIDMVLETSDYVYVMEFKLNGSAEEALQQINDKGYALPFLSSGKKVFKIGINFSAETKSIDRWAIEE